MVLFVWDRNLKIRGLGILENKKRLTITLSSQVLKYLLETAKNKGLSKSALITIALEKYKEGQN